MVLISADKERQRSRTHSTRPTGTSALSIAYCVHFMSHHVDRRIPLHMSADTTRVLTLQTGARRSRPLGPDWGVQGRLGGRPHRGRQGHVLPRRGARLPSIHAPSTRGLRAGRVPTERPPTPGPRPRLPALTQGLGRARRSRVAGPAWPWRPRLQPPAGNAALRHLVKDYESRHALR